MATDRQTGTNLFQIEERYILTFYSNKNQKGPLYIDSVLAVPTEVFTDSVLRHLPLDKSPEFIELCSRDNFANKPGNTSEYCRDSIFSLTADFNTAALPCDCAPQGSVRLILG